MDELTRLERQFRIAAMLHQSSDGDAALPFRALELICAELGASQGCLLIFDRDEMQTALLYDVILPAADSDWYWRALSAQGVIGYARRSARVVTVRDLLFDLRWMTPPSGSTLPTTGSAICAPFKLPDDQDGVLLLFSPTVGGFDDQTAHLLREITPLVSALIQRAQMHAAAAPEGEDEQLRRDMAAMIYHDMRNPLQNIQASLYGIEKLLGTGDVERTAGMLFTAAYSTRQITRMVKTLLDLDGLEANRAVLKQQTVQITELLRDAAELARPAITEANQTLNFNFTRDLPSVVVDIDMIQRVVVNLIENAVKYTPQGGRITLRTEPNGRSVMISVADSGSGIPDHLKSEIFDKYFRIKHDNAPGGFGLGLAFCRLAVEAHGGSIWVDNAPSGGAVFTFTLPAVEASAPARQQPAASLAS